jgi:hypothetical protein
MSPSHWSRFALSLSLFYFAHRAHAQSSGQPGQTSYLNQFQIVGNSLVSAQQVRFFHQLERSCTYFALFQLFLGTPDKVYVLDKVENNPTQINGHPAWASGTQFLSSSRVLVLILLAEYDVSANTARAMDVITNTFCAVILFLFLPSSNSAHRYDSVQGGNVLGNGTWLNVGGNDAVTYGGLDAANQDGDNPYGDSDGGQS